MIVHAFPSTVATTSCGPPAGPEAAPADVAPNAAAIAAWSRPDTRMAGHPLIAARLSR
jgi:hypothetical protein